MCMAVAGVSGLDVVVVGWQTGRRGLLSVFWSGIQLSSVDEAKARVSGLNGGTRVVLEEKEGTKRWAGWAVSSANDTADAVPSAASATPVKVAVDVADPVCSSATPRASLHRHARVKTKRTFDPSEEAAKQQLGSRKKARV